MSILTGAQQRLIHSLANPLPRSLQNEFFRRISAEIAGLSAIGDGALYRLAAGVQRSMLEPPRLDGINGR